MAIDAINPISNVQNPTVVANKNTNNVGKNSFDDIFQKSLSEINSNLNVSESQMDNILIGSDEDFNSYLINSQKTEISLQLTMQIRNKVIDAYKEIMRMQV